MPDEAAVEVEGGRCETFLWAVHLYDRVDFRTILKSGCRRLVRTEAGWAMGPGEDRRSEKRSQEDLFSESGLGAPTASREGSA